MSGDARFWLVNKRFDLFWYLAPLTLPILFWGTWSFLRIKGIDEADATNYLLLLFYSCFDHPHVARTFSRTHLDKIEFRRHKMFHVTAYPILCLLAYCAVKQGQGTFLMFVFSVIGLWHIYRQNFGLIRIYPRGDADKEKINYARRREWWFFHLLMINAMAPYFTRDDVDFLSKLVLPFQDQMRILKYFILALTLVIGIFWLTAEFRQWRSANQKPWPRVWFLFGVISVHSFNYWLSHWMPIGMMVILDTAYHDLQYQGWMNHYLRRVALAPESTIKKWIVSSLIYGFMATTVGEVTGSIGVVVSMMTLYHYLADGIIWKFRSDPELQPMLV